MIIHNPILTGSFTVNGTDVSSITSSAASLTSLNAYTASQNNRNGTYATTGSNTFAGIQTVNSNLVVTGSITAQTLVVQTITSSVDFVTGSTRFGSLLSNTHVFSGSVTMNPGGLFVSSSGLVGIGTTSPSVALHVANGSATTVGLFEYTGGANSYIGIKSTSGTNYIGNVGYDMTFEAGGSEKVRISSGGNVGIGITNTSYKFEVRSTSTTSETIANFQNAVNAINRYNIIRIGQPTYAAYIGMCLDTYDTAYFSTNSNPTGALGIYYSTANRLGVNVRQPISVFHSVGSGQGIGGFSGDTYGIRIDNGGAYSSGMSTIHGVDTSLYGSYQPIMINGSDVRFGTSATERMRIASSGNVGIGNTSPSSKLSVDGNLQITGTITNFGTGTDTYTQSTWYVDSSNQILFENGRTTNSAGGTGRTVYFTWRGGPSVGGGVQLQHGTNAWAAYTSDARLKTKVADIENGVDTIMKLNPIKFKWTRELENSRTVTGFTAQNVEEAIPDAVFNSWQDEELGDVKSYYQDYLVPYLVKAIQELKAEIDELKNK